MRRIFSAVWKAAFLGVMASGPGASATPSCSFDGVWTATAQGGATTFTTKVVTATHTVTVDRTGGNLAPAHIEGTYTYDSGSGQATITNKTVSTQDAAFFACLNIPGTYTVTFTDCTHMTLALVSDACTPRTMSAGHSTFTKQ